VRKKENQIKNINSTNINDICHLPGFITFFFIVAYVALIKQAVVKRRRSECSTHSNALDDVKVLCGFKYATV
jgi:hypothetical protein